MSNKSYTQRIKAAEARGSVETASSIRRERDLAYINDVHGMSKEIVRLLDRRDYPATLRALQSAIVQLQARYDGLARAEGLLPCAKCGHAYGTDWLDGGETCPICKLVG